MNRKECKNKIAIGLLFLLTSLCIVAFIIVAWLAYVPVKVIEFDEPLVIVDAFGELKAEITPGEILYYRIKYRKYKNFPCTIVAQLVNKYTLQFPVFESNLKTSDKENLKDTEYWDEAIAQLSFPETAMNGEHYLNIAFSYRVNPLRTEITTLRSNRFNVIGGLVGKKQTPLMIWRK